MSIYRDWKAKAIARDKPLPHGCEIWTAYQNTDDGGQLVADFARLSDGTIILLRDRRYARPVVTMFCDSVAVRGEVCDV